LHSGRRHEKAVSFHANYRKGLEEKKKDLADHGYWLATEQGCRDLKLDI
jgi:hypothetical protein